LPIGAPFRPSDDDVSRNPTSVGGQHGLEARDPSGGDIRSGRNGVDAVETVTKRVKMVGKTIRRSIGVVRYDFGITDLHPQVAEGDG
jgi:hypothetical protein